MAKAKVLDSKVVIKSEVLNDENLFKASMLKPSVLKLIDVDSMSTIYEVVKGEDVASMSIYGATFVNGSTTCDIIGTQEEVKVKVTSLLTKINKIEEQVSDFIESLDDEELDIEFLN